MREEFKRTERLVSAKMSATKLECHVEFDNELKTYRSGSIVMAKVNLFLHAPLKFQCIYAKFIGEATTKWVKRSRRKERRGRSVEIVKEFTSKEGYFNINQDIVRNDRSPEFMLEPKSYTYPIRFTLPANLPSSFSGKWGAIRYIVRICVDDNGRIDELHETEFKVTTPLDLNKFPHLKQPAQIEKSHSFCCCWCRSGPLTLTVKLPATGYCPKQSIPITVDVENSSNVDVLGVRCYIKQIATFHVNNPKPETRTEESVLCEVTLEGVPKYISKTRHGKLLIPDIRSTNLTSCEIIELKHLLKIKGLTAGAKQNLYGEIPITLGTEPFTDSSFLNQVSDRGAESSNRVLVLSPSDVDTDMPPPSYADVTKGPNSFEERGRPTAASAGWNVGRPEKL